MIDPTPRRRFQFSLRTLLVFVTACPVLCSWLAVKIRKVEQQRVAAEAISKLGGFVTYDYELDPSGNLWLDGRASGPDWLRNVLGVDFFKQGCLA